MRSLRWLALLGGFFLLLSAAWGNDGNTELYDIAQKIFGEKESEESSGKVDTGNNESDSDTSTAKKRVAAIFTLTYFEGEDGGLVRDNNLEYRVGNFIHVINAIKDHGQFNDLILVAGKNMVKSNIENQFRELADKTNPGDEIFIYWEGHGGSGGSDAFDLIGTEADNKHEFFYMYDYNTKHGIIRDDEFGEMLKILDGRRVMILLEVCHSGGLITPDGTKSLIKTVPVAKGDEAKGDEGGLSYACRGNVDYTKQMKIFKQLMEGKVSKGSAKSKKSDNTASLVVKSITKRSTKDISPKAPNLAILCACSKTESSYCAVMNEADADGNYSALELPGSDGNLYPVSPMACSLVAVMQDKTGEFRKNKKCGRFSDVADIVKEFAPKNAARLSAAYGTNVTQTPVYQSSISDVCVSPESSEE